MTTPFDDESRPLSVLRIYVRRRTMKTGPGFWRRLFGVSAAQHLAEQALRAGAVYETVTLGHMSFVHGARRVQVDVSDVPPDTLPTCVELVGNREVLDAFAADNDAALEGALLVRLDGVGVCVSGAGPT